MPSILNELNKYNRKVKHWAWWVFPTDKVGKNEPGIKTCVKYQEIEYFLKNVPKEWKLVLKKICNLITNNNGLHNIIPKIDYGRINFFIKFWDNRKINNNKKYSWLKKIRECLSNFI